jgi:hypothetical protein
MSGVFQKVDVCLGCSKRAVDAGLGLTKKARPSPMQAFS